MTAKQTNTAIMALQFVNGMTLGHLTRLFYSKTQVYFVYHELNHNRRLPVYTIIEYTTSSVII